MKLVKTALAALLAALLAACGPPRQDTIVVGSKNFTEQLVLGEIIAQQIEAHTRLHVERRFYLWGTYICQQAILAGHIDIYPEYTGTALTAILKMKPEGDPAAVLDRVRRAYTRRFHLVVGKPFGFNDSFALVVRGSTARRLHLHTISDAVPYARQWRAGVGYEFMGRPDGYPLLERVYGLAFDSTRVMDLGLLYRALLDHQVNLVVGNTTDGVLSARDLAVLRDDKHAFPPYQAVPIIRSCVLALHPELGPVLDALAGKVSARDIQQLNYAIEGKHLDVKQVVHQFLIEKHLIDPAAPAARSGPGPIRTGVSIGRRGLGTGNARQRLTRRKACSG
ncbi:MAG TPA: glycine betaine ABC transporter substrate-binding protein [Patescibacteria group bacterium]|nr:glycine betaine ABC transporter substrate-binding protein [Patescibacteria group bacterium]